MYSILPKTYNMKRLSLLFFLLLVAWIIIASYWYVCKIRNHCGAGPETLADVTDTLKSKIDSTDSIAVALNYLHEAGTRVYYFDFASAEYTPSVDDDVYISALKLYHSSRPDAIAILEGHADNRGSSAANEKYSKLRAEAVLEYLVEKGVDESKIKTLWKSDTEPAASNNSEDGRRLNRRVEITIN